MLEHGPWKIVKSNPVYEDPWLKVHQDDVIRPDGEPGSFCVAHLKPGVCVLAIDDEDHVYLTEEFHYGVGRTTLEGVSGGREPGEAALLTAKRELAEELGIQAEEWTDLGTVDPFTSNVVSPTQLFVARRLTIGTQSLEGTEVIQRVRMPFEQAIESVMNSTITHAPSCVLILKAIILRSHSTN